MTIIGSCIITKYYQNNENCQRKIKYLRKSPTPKGEMGFSVDTDYTIDDELFAVAIRSSRIVIKLFNKININCNN